MANPGNDKLLELMTATHAFAAVCAVAELGVVDLMPASGSRPVGELALESKCDEQHLFRTLRLLASHGFFKETEPRTFALTPVGASLRGDADESTREGWRMLHRVFTKSQQELVKGLQTGNTPLTSGLGAPLFEFLGSHPTDAAIFDAGMTAIHGPETSAMLKAYDFSSIKTLADIGGGNGTLMIEALKRHNDLQGIVFDLGHATKRARANLKAAGVAERCQVVTGNFFEEIPAGADAYLFRHTIHDWTDDQCVSILEGCRKVIPAEGRLLVVEAVVPPGNDRSPAKDFDFAMLLFSGGRERTEDEYHALFESAGFELKGITPTDSPVSVVEGRPV